MSAADRPSAAWFWVSQDLATSTALPAAGPDRVSPSAGVMVRGVPKRGSQVARAPGLALTIAETASACAWVGLVIAPTRLSTAVASAAPAEVEVFVTAEASG